MYFLLPAKQNQAENWIEFEDFEAFAIELRWFLLLEVPFFSFQILARLCDEETEV